MSSPRKLRAGRQNQTVWLWQRFIEKEDRPLGGDYLENFAMVDYRIGAIFLINGKVEGMDCVFRSIPAGDSGASRPPIPDDSGHSQY